MLETDLSLSEVVMISIKWQGIIFLKNKLEKSFRLIRFDTEILMLFTLLKLSQMSIYFLKTKFHVDCFVIYATHAQNILKKIISLLFSFDLCLTPLKMDETIHIKQKKTNKMYMNYNLNDQVRLVNNECFGIFLLTSFDYFFMSFLQL